MGKKYYWLQLKEDFFRQKEIKLLRKIAGGDTYTIIYLKMMLMSLKDEGKILFEGIGSTFAEEVALEIDEDIENVEITIQYLLSKDLLQVADYEGFMSDVPSLIGSETDSARRMRKHRKIKGKKQNKLQSDGQVSQSDKPVTKGDTELDKELDKELDTELEKNTHEEQTEEKTDTDSFESFWEVYPNKKSKKKAVKLFEKVLEDKEATFEQLIEGAKKYALEVDQKGTPEKYIKHPNTWLSHGCWADEYDIYEVETDDRYSNLPF